MPMFKNEIKHWEILYEKHEYPNPLGGGESQVILISAAQQDVPLHFPVTTVRTAPYCLTAQRLPSLDLRHHTCVVLFFGPRQLWPTSHPLISLLGWKVKAREREGSGFQQKIKASRYWWERVEFFFKYHLLTICKQTVSVLFFVLEPCTCVWDCWSNPSLSLYRCIQGAQTGEASCRDHTALEGRLGLELVGGRYKLADGRRVGKRKMTERWKQQKDWLPGQRGFPGGSVVKNPPANAGQAKDVGSIPGSGRSPGVGKKPQSSILAWKIPRTEKPDGPQSKGLQRVGHYQATEHTRGQMGVKCLS